MNEECGAIGVAEEVPATDGRENRDMICSGSAWEVQHVTGAKDGELRSEMAQEAGRGRCGGCQSGRLLRAVSALLHSMD